jgi:hypothetical protein
VKRLFKRLHDDLLDVLLTRLVQYRDDPRRASLLSGIISTIELDSDVLQRTLERVADERDIDEAMSLLVMRHRGVQGNKLSSETLREKLFSWRRDY